MGRFGLTFSIVDGRPGGHHGSATFNAPDLAGDAHQSVKAWPTSRL
jgi:hypothetical protein